METRNSSGQRVVASLVGARLPEDRGVASLGLLMQLAGTIGLIVFTALAIVPMFTSDGQSGAFLFFGALGCACRAAVHRAAGSALLYGGTGRPLRAVHVYVAIAVAHTIATLFALREAGIAVDTVLLIEIGAVLLAWPATLLVVFHLPSFREIARGGAPTSEDLGFESTAVLMTLFGIMGALFAGLMLAYLLETPGVTLTSPPLLFLTGLFLLLMLRSLFQILAGLKGTVGANYHAANEVVGRYCGFGAASALVGGVVVFVEVFVSGFVPAALLFGVTATALLLAWPMILRRFYAERSFTVLLAGDGAMRFRRAPDAGLTSLGWFLLALGSVTLAGSLPSALLDDGLSASQLVLLGDRFEGTEVAANARSEWWTVGVAALQLWAAIELIRMTDRYRLAATTFGAIGLVVTAYVTWPLVGATSDALRAAPAGIGPALFVSLAVVAQAAFGLVTAAAAIVLANRVTTPDAIARTRNR